MTVSFSFIKDAASFFSPPSYGGSYVYAEDTNDVIYKLTNNENERII